MSVLLTISLLFSPAQKHIKHFCSQHLIFHANWTVDSYWVRWQTSGDGMIHLQAVIQCHASRDFNNYYYYNFNNLIVKKHSDLHFHLAMYSSKKHKEYFSTCRLGRSHWWVKYLSENRIGYQTKRTNSRVHPLDATYIQKTKPTPASLLLLIISLSLNDTSGFTEVSTNGST